MSDSNDNGKAELSQEDRLVEALKVLLKDFQIMTLLGFVWMVILSFPLM